MRRTRLWIIILVAALVVIGGSAAGLRMWYNNNLKPVSASTDAQYFTVDPGSGVHAIATELKAAGLIRNISAFETYVTTNDYREKLQAGTYRLSPSMSVQTIVKKMVNGDVARDLMTILPGKRLDQIKQAFRDAGYSSAEVRAAFNSENYASHQALANLPKGASLEGYLYPDSFQKQSNTPASTIIKQSLDEMSKYLTSDIINGFRARGLSAHEGVTLASIIVRESDNDADDPIVAQVLLSRIARDMPLQADATAFYAADVAGQPHSVSIESPYNTYLHTGLPPGPISNVTKEALFAAAHPAGTDYLYYVTGDDGKTRFSRTVEEHNANVQKYCKQRCSQ